METIRVEYERKVECPPHNIIYFPAILIILQMKNLIIKSLNIGWNLVSLTAQGIASKINKKQGVGFYAEIGLKIPVPVVQFRSSAFFLKVKRL